MVKIGDIVAVKKWRGLWVARAFDGMWNVIKCNNEEPDVTAHRARAADLVVVASPEIGEGDWLKYRGGDARVISVTDDSVRVTYTERNETAGGGFIRHTDGESDVQRAALVSENFSAFL